MNAEKSRPALLHLVLPIGIAIGVVAFLSVSGRLTTVVTAAALSFFTVGKLIILSGSVPDTFSMGPWELAAMVFCMDLFYAYVLAFNLDWLFKVKGIGPWLERLVNYCKYWIHSQPWMRRFAFTGVMLFVMFPLTGTGAPGGSILGRLVGLRARVTLFAIGLGSMLGCGLLAAFATQLEPVFSAIKDELWFKASGLVILAIVVVVLFVLGRKVSRAAEEYAQSQTAGDDA